MEIKVRNLPDEVGCALARLARANGLSREEYLRNILSAHVARSELLETESRYDTLVRLVTDELKETRQVMEFIIGYIEERENT